MRSLKRAISAMIAAALLLSLLSMLPGCSSVGTVREADFYDSEKTHKPTDAEVLEIKARILRQWALVYERMEELGLTKVQNDVDFAAEQGIELVTFADMVAALGRPHQQNPYTGMFYIQWETTSGRVFDFAFTTSGEAPRVNTLEQHFWLYEHYGVVWEFPKISVETMSREEIFDAEKTHKPTDEEVAVFMERRLQSYSDGSILTLIDAIEALGLPHGYGHHSGRFSFGWETVSGAQISIPVNLPQYLPFEESEEWSEENNLWAYYYFGVV